MLFRSVNTLLQKFRQQKEIINGKQEKITHLESHEYDPNCKYCTSNVFVQNAIEAQNTIDADRTILNELQQQIENFNTELESLKPVFELETQYNKLKNTIATKKITLERNELQLQILESDLQTRESELETCIERQESFRKNETAIVHNQIIDIKINECKEQIVTCTDQIKIGRAHV